MMPDLPLSPGQLPRIGSVPEFSLSSAEVKSPGKGQRKASHICLSPTKDSIAFKSVASPKTGQEPRITGSMISTPKIPGRRRIALAPMANASNESLNHHHVSNSVKLLLSPDDMKRVRLRLQAEEKLTVDPSSGSPKRIAVRCKEMNGGKKILCMESLQALFSQEVHPSERYDASAVMTPRQRRRRASFTMTPNTTKSIKTRVSPVDITFMKEDTLNSGTFQKQRRRHSYSSLSRAVFADSSVEDGFAVITDRVGQSISPPPSPRKETPRRKSKKIAKRDVV
jgi:hypothetical protein